MGGPGTFAILVVVLSASFSGCTALQITRMSVPDFVKNGSVEHVVLDCEYRYDAELDRKLVVKWYHEQDPKAVYQWIPELNSRTARKDYRADPNYNLPGVKDPYTKSRALKLHLPTTQVSGKYTCEVTSHHGSDSEEDEMIVYTLPTAVSLNYTIFEDTVELECTVKGVHPVPNISLFLVEPAEVNRTFLDDGDLDFEYEEGAYEVEFSVNISVEDLPTVSDGLTFFGCIVEIEGAEYEKEVRVPYFPNPVAEAQEGDCEEEDDKKSGSQLLLNAFSSLLLPLLVLLVT